MEYRTDLSELCPAGWRKRRRFGAGLEACGVGNLEIVLMCREGQSDFAHGNPEIEFGFLFYGGKFFFGFLAVFDDFANLARVFAIESFGDGHFDGGFLGELDHHGNPGDGLQNSPVSADREDQKNRNDGLTKAMPHFR